MPSRSLLSWRDDRTPCLQEIDRQCAACQLLDEANPRLVGENLRGFIVLLSAHFQGFCRDLYTECAQIVISTMPPSLQLAVQTQFTTGLALDRGNPNLANIRKDFDRFGNPLGLDAFDPANPSRLVHLNDLNTWRNIVAHHGTVPSGGLPTQLEIQAWVESCDGLAGALDGIMCNRLQAILGLEPWPATPPQG